ncbi:hypothetical protein [Laspinema sp. D2d]|nr:hypothetical protein [Laspinema sp. D2d]
MKLALPYKTDLINLTAIAFLIPQQAISPTLRRSPGPLEMA